MKKVSLRTVFMDSATYLIGSAASNVLSILLLPLFTRILSPTDYGTISIVEITSTLIFTVFSIGQVQSINRLYHTSESGAGKSTVVFNVLLLTVSVMIVTALVLIFFNRFASRVLFGAPENGYLVWIMALGLPFQGIGQLGNALQRSKLQATSVTAINFALFITGLSLNIAAVAWLHLGVPGVIIAQLLTKTLKALIYLPLLIKECRPALISLPFLNETIRFGLPFVPHNLAVLLIFSVDRYFIQHYWSLHEVGIYAVAYRFGMILNFVNSAFQTSWFPSSFALKDRNQQDPLILRINFLWYMILSGITVCIIGYIQPIFHVLVSNSFNQSLDCIVIILIGYFFLGLDVGVKVVIPLNRQSRLLPIGSLSALGANICFNFLLIPAYGAIGAAIATALSYGIYFLVDFIIAQKVHPLPYNMKQFMAAIGAGAVLVMLIYISDAPVTFILAGSYAAFCAIVIYRKFKNTAKISRGNSENNGRHTE